MESASVLDASQTKPSEGGASFSLGSRLTRLVWNLSWLVLASWTPAPLHRYRVAILRLFGAQVDWTAHVYGNAKIWLPANLTMGAHSCLGPRVNCYCMDRITLADRAVVSQDSTLCAGSHDISDANFQLITRPIVIGEQAWVAAEVFVGPGVTVGKGAVLGARSVVFKDAIENGIYVGNPAKLVKERQWDGQEAQRAPA
ncbi:putative colanic acid biosynthesis acetyltransferase [Stieleria magnilauensis]|uniref:Acetyltransferase n=1 Tax=Stieleria magnilauensis TaxID=2527963 RepID=A0ABX5XS32_9BACT|nr:Putative acetyltransferase [Planctomycetes bacterium TBK1r]